MMTQPNFVLSSISWRDLCPWLLLFRTIGIALRPSVVSLAFVGVLLSPLGWSTAKIFLAEGDQAGETYELLEQEDNWIKIREQISTPEFWTLDFDWSSGPLDQGPLAVFASLYEGHLQLLNPRLNIRQYTYYFFGTLWTLFIWSTVGALICRIAATQLTRDERTGISEAFQFIRKRLGAVWASSLVPLGLILVFAIPFFLIGLLMKVNFLLLLVGIGWFVVAMIGLMMALVLIPLFFGYPLLWPAIATEGSDAFEAVSRSYSYPTQKPFHYVFYWVVILFVGYLAAFVASVLANKTIEFTRWGTSWGAGTERVVQIENQLNSPAGQQEASTATPSDQEIEDQTPMLFGVAVSSIHFWEQGILIITSGFNYGFFFVAMTGLYLLLRKDQDYTELDEIVIDHPEEEIPLPKIQATEPPLPNQLAEKETSSNSGPGDPGTATTPAIATDAHSESDRASVPISSAESASKSEGEHSDQDSKKETPPADKVSQTGGGETEDQPDENTDKENLVDQGSDSDASNEDEDDGELRVEDE